MCEPEVKVILDSLAPCGKRLTTFQLTYQRFIHSELMTHRQFSRNASSSRAIPVDKMLTRVLESPAMPIHWGVNQRGMQAEQELDGQERAEAMTHWLTARNNAVAAARCLAALGCHKQIVNRLIEPFAWMTTIVTATEWSNFFSQRCHKDAQPEFRRLAYLMAEQYYDVSTPREVCSGMWHLPYLQKDEYASLRLLTKIHVSVARCARVSYLNQEGARDIASDLELYDRLVKGTHWSPFEHVAMARPDLEVSGNLIGWRQFRKTFREECRLNFNWDAVRSRGIQ